MNNPDARGRSKPVHEFLVLAVEGIPIEALTYKQGYRARMQRAGITQRQLCDAMGTDHSRISKWLRPEYDLMFSTIRRMEIALQIVLEQRSP